MIRNIARRLIYREKYSSDTYISFLRKKGVKIGDDCIIYAPSKVLIDCQYPWMITIGNHVRITQGVKMITHDFSWSVLKLFDDGRNALGAVLGASGTIKVGNNVFIGMNSIITRNVTIGDNVIIGAGSIVTKDCASGGVYAGNPARFIMSVDDYYAKRQSLQLAEAKTLAQEYYSRYHKMPEETVFNEYFMLFKTDITKINKSFKKKLELCGNYEESPEYTKQTKPAFKYYNSFLDYCFSEEQNGEH